MRKPSWAGVLIVALGLNAAACDDGEDGGGRDAAGDDASTDDHDAAMDAGAEEDAAPHEEDASDDGMQAVSIRFKAKVGAQDLACGEEYPNQGTTNVTATPQDFRFYVQELRLVRKDGTEEQVELDVKAPFQSKDVALLDFTDGEGSCGSGGTVLNTTITGRVAAGDYEGIVFVNGVPEALNHAGPAESAEPPLDDVTLFWGWLSGYRFIVAELLPVGSATHGAGGADAGATDGGHADDAEAGHGDGGGGHGASEAAFAHIGSTGCAGNQGSFTCMRQARNEIRLDGFDAKTNYVIADLAQVFKTSDLQQPLQCHGIAAPCAAPYAAFGIDMDTGQPSEGQEVFRVE